MISPISKKLPEALLIAAVLFGPLAFGAVEPWSWAILSTLVFATLASCAASGFPDFRHPIYWTVFPSVAVLLLIGLLQRLNPNQISDPAAWNPFTVSPDSTQRALWRWSTYAAILWCMPQIFYDTASVRRLVKIVFWLGFAVAIIGIVQMNQNRLMIYGLRLATYGHEPFGPYYNRDHAAALLSMSAYCGIGVFWDELSRRGGSSESSDEFNFWARQSLVLFAVGIICAGLLSTLSRGALIAFLLSGAILIMVACRSNIRRMVLLGVAGLVCMLGIAFSPIAGRLTGAYIRSAASYRISMYEAGSSLFRDFPAFGVGLGGFQRAYRPYQPKDIVGIVNHAHNDWLELLLEEGIVGLAAYVTGLLLFFRWTFSEIVSPRRRLRSGLFFSISAGLLAFILHGLVEFGFQIPANAVIFLCLLGASGTLASAGREPDGSGPRKPRAAARIAIGLIALLFAVFSNAQLFLEKSH